MRNPFDEDAQPFAKELGDEVYCPYQKEEFENLLARLQDLKAAAGPQGPFAGSVVLLKSARAGFGKSTLASRFAVSAKSQATIVPLAFELEREIGWENVLSSVLGCLHRDVDPATGITRIDHLARYLFGLVTRELIARRQIPCENPERSIAGLRSDYLVMFNFGDERQAVGQWFRQHFRQLLPTMSNFYSAPLDLTPAGAAAWFRFLFAYSEAITTGEDRASIIRKMMAGEQLTNRSDEVTTASQSGKELFRSFALLLASMKPVIFVVDDLDAYFGKSQDAQEIAYVLASVSKLLPACMLVVCMNEDLWRSAFEGKIASAYQDRLDGDCLVLDGLDESSASGVIETRLASHKVEPAKASGFLDVLDLAGFLSAKPRGSVSPRQLIRYARERWDAYVKGRLTTGMQGSPVASSTILSTPFSDEIHEPEKEKVTGKEEAPGEGIPLPVSLVAPLSSLLKPLPIIGGPGEPEPPLIEDSAAQEEPAAQKEPADFESTISAEEAGGDEAAASTPRLFIPSDAGQRRGGARDLEVDKEIAEQIGEWSKRLLESESAPGAGAEGKGEARRSRAEPGPTSEPELEAEFEPEPLEFIPSYPQPVEPPAEIITQDAPNEPSPAETQKDEEKGEEKKSGLDAVLAQLRGIEAGLTGPAYQAEDPGAGDNDAEEECLAEEARSEAVRLEEARLEEARREEARREEARHEEVRSEEKRGAEARIAEQRLEEQRLERERLEKVRIENARLENANQGKAWQEKARLKEERREEAQADSVPVSDEVPDFGVSAISTPEPKSADESGSKASTESDPATTSSVVEPGMDGEVKTAPPAKNGTGRDAESGSQTNSLWREISSSWSPRTVPSSPAPIKKDQEQASAPSHPTPAPSSNGAGEGDPGRGESDSDAKADTDLLRASWESAGGIDPQEQRQELRSQQPGAASPRISSLPEGEEQSASPVMKGNLESIRVRFTQVLDQMLRDEALLGIDEGRLQRLIGAGGRRFPVVDLKEFHLPDCQRAPVLQWSFPESDIVFGFEPFNHLNYWKQLVSYTRTRAHPEAPASGRSSGSRAAKLIIFADARRPFAVSRWLVSSTSDNSNVEHIDTVELDGSALAQLYAAEYLVQEAEDGLIAAAPGDVIEALASELEFFWKRITRPLPN